MFTSTAAPDVTVDVIVGKQVVATTPAPSATPLPTGGVPSVTPGGIPPRKTYVPKPLSIYGYAPSNSTVKLNGIGVSGQVVAKTDGYFRFDSIYSYSRLYPEICIQAEDNEKRTTQPVCIPPIPEDNIVPIEVGPLLLSPTLNISKNNIIEGQESYASGYSRPNSKVTIYLAKQNKNTLIGNLSLIREVNAYYLPQYEVDSDENGHFEFALPSSSVSNYKLFAAGRMGDSPSAKSNTLSFRVLPKIISFLDFLYNLLFGSWMTVVFIIEVILIVLLGYGLSKSNKEGGRGIEKRERKPKSKKTLADVQRRYLELLKSKGINV